MQSSTAVTLVGQAVILVAKLAGPVLLATLVVGLVISLFQAVTTVQESSLTFLPKLLAVAVILAVAGHWMLAQLTDYTEQLYTSIPKLLNG